MNKEKMDLISSKVKYFRVCYTNECSEKDMQDFLHLLCNTYGANQVSFYFGVSCAFMCDVLSKARTVGKKIPQVLGYERMILYKNKENNNGSEISQR